MRKNLYQAMNKLAGFKNEAFGITIITESILFFSSIILTPIKPTVSSQ